MANELHTMPLKCESLMSSRRVRRMKLDEFGAFMKLLIESWLDGAKLPNNDDELQSIITPEGDDQWMRIKKFVVDKMFDPSEDGKYLTNRHQVEIWNDVLEMIHSRSQKASKAANSRWNNATSNAQAMHKHSPSNAIQSESESQSEKKEKISKKEISGIPKDLQEPFADYLEVYEFHHGKPHQKQIEQIVLSLLRIPADYRMESIQNSMMKKHKFICDCRSSFGNQETAKGEPRKEAFREFGGIYAD